MKRHFTDAAYYARRAAEEAATGLREELEPVGERARELAGREPETDPSASASASRETQALMPASGYHSVSGSVV